MKDLDPDFVEALADLFGEYAAEEANNASIQKVHGHLHVCRALGSPVAEPG